MFVRGRTGLIGAATALTVAGCGGERKEAAVPAGVTTTTLTGTAAPGRARVVLVTPSPAAALHTLDGRITRAGISDVRAAAGPGQQVTLDVPATARAAVQTLTVPGELRLYDWEADVLGPRCRPAPTDTTVTGGPMAGTAAALPEFDAVARARRCPADGGAQPTYYLVGDGSRSVDGGPATTAAAARAQAPSPQIAQKDRIVEAAAGIRLIRAEGGGDRWFVLRDTPALTNQDIRLPQAITTPEPGVTFAFTPTGGKRWQELTRDVAQRGEGFVVTAAGQGLQQVYDRAQHVAITLDGRLLSLPYIDFEQNPDGIDPTNGTQIVGGFTPASAKSLAALLALGPLPPGTVARP